MRAASRRYSRRGVLGTATAASALIAVGCGGDDDTPSTGGNTPTGGSTPASGSTPAANNTPVEGITDYPSYTSVVKASEYIQKYNWRNLPKPVGDPRAGGHYVHAVGLIPPHFDPFGPLVNGYPIPTNLRQIYNQLTRLKMEWDDDLDKADPEGELAEGWEQPDDNTLTFKLRQGVKFQNIAPVNGRVFNAGDVKYTYDNYRETPISGYFESVESITAVDDSTVQLKFKQPAAYFLNVISGPSTSILPVELDEQNRRENPVGTGPFQLKGGEFRQDQLVKYVRNPDYWEVRNGITLPYLDSVTTQFPADATVALEGFRNGQYDSSAYVNTFSLVDNMIGTNPDTIFQVVSDHPSVIYYLGLQQNNPKWQDERVRRALAYAIDIQQIIDIALGGSATPGCLVDWASMGFKVPPQLSETKRSRSRTRRARGAPEGGRAGKPADLHPVHQHGRAGPGHLQYPPAATQRRRHHRRCRYQGWPVRRQRPVHRQRPGRHHDDPAAFRPGRRCLHLPVHAQRRRFELVQH